MTWTDKVMSRDARMNAAIGEIDWYEIAANILSELPETVGQ